MAPKHHQAMPPRRRRPLLPALACLALTACGRGELEPCAYDGTETFQVSPNRDVDILFMVDNSSGMGGPQQKLLAGFPAFLQGLGADRPNLHIAVVSSDMGAGTAVSGCAGNGQAGLFQTSPRLTRDGSLCQTTLQNAGRFLESVHGVTNFTGDLGDVLSCIAALGESGCGFEQPLLSVTHALGADNYDSAGIPRPPVENEGFLRSGAALAIVMLTSEDDCSAPEGAADELFPRDTTSTLMSTLGPPIGYRCNEFGHLCGNPLAPPPRLPPGGDHGATVTLEDCVPAEAAGRLTPVATFEAAIKALKPDPANQILVAAITGAYPGSATQGYAVEWRPAAAEPDTWWPTVKHSCVSSDFIHGDPAVRLSDWVRRFGPRGLLRSICDDDWQATMKEIGAAIAGLVEVPAPGPSRCPTVR